MLSTLPLFDSPSVINDQPPFTDPRSQLAAVRERLRGWSFLAADDPRNRVAGETLCDVLSGLISDPEAPADWLCQLAVRTVRRALAFLRSIEAIQETAFRVNGSPRCRRVIDWQRLLDWVETRAEAVGHRTRRRAGPAPRSEKGQGRAQQSLLLIDRPQPESPRVTRRDEIVLGEKLASLQVAPVALQRLCVPIEKATRLIDHYVSSALTNDLGETVYAWGPGLLYARLTAPEHSARLATDWPKESDEWRRIKSRRRARAIEEAMKADRPADNPKVEPAQQHQLELKFANRMQSVESVIEALLPDPVNSHLVRWVRTKKSIPEGGMRRLILMALEKAETG